MSRASFSLRRALARLIGEAGLSPSQAKARPTEKGGALLAVLWMTAALAAIAFSLATTVRTETERASTNSEGLRAWYLASGSVERGIQWMMWGADYRMPDGKPRFWESNMSRMRMTYPSGEAVIEMIPEMSKLNINTASPDKLLRVIAVVTGDIGRAQQITDGIVNWRTPAGAATGLDNAYLSLGSTFRARHASFQEIEELLLIPGVTPELYYGNYLADPGGRLYPRGGLRDSLSVWGSGGPFDVNTVSPAVMEAFGVPREAVTGILVRRAVEPFKNQQEMVQAGFPAGAPFSLGGNVIWTLRANARLRRPDGSTSDVVRSAAAVVKMLDRRTYFENPVHVLRYYDDAWSQFALQPPQLPPALLQPGLSQNVPPAAPSGDSAR
jgi:general secretion pathway protein K